jgi:hypothetical protein
MTWLKIGQIFSTDKNFDWMWSHSANPVPYILNEEKGIVRVFFTCRNKINESHIGFVDIDFYNDFKILNLSEQPIISPGKLGQFDDNGTAMGYLILKENRFYLFYLGWNLRVSVPWLNTIGLAISDSIDGEFKKISLAPIMDRSNEDPFSISYPSILLDDGKYKMWYGSNLSWGKYQNEMQHVIKYAESEDLILWKRTNEIHIGLQNKNEYALSKPWVMKDGDLFKMWYSYRANGNISNYRIGYAESSDSKQWIRKDNEACIDVSPGGWDCEMICYPSVFKLKAKTYMLFNGNGYGKTGFGLAILER